MVAPTLHGPWVSHFWFDVRTELPRPHTDTKKSALIQRFTGEFHVIPLARNQESVPPESERVILGPAMVGSGVSTAEKRKPVGLTRKKRKYRYFGKR